MLINQFLKKTLKVLTVFSVLFCIFGFTSQIVTESTWFTSGLSYLSTKNNFHVVKEGSLYRSGTLSQEDLIQVVKENNIKLVVDLRKSGDEPEQHGFSESQIVRSLGSRYEWIPMVGSNTKQLSPLSKLIELSKDETGPVLIHCSSGTHRSGVATAVWLMEKEGVSPEEASMQLSPNYGYFSWERNLKSAITGSKTIDYVIWNYLSSFRATGIKFSDWLMSKNDPL